VHSRPMPHSQGKEEFKYLLQCGGQHEEGGGSGRRETDSELGGGWGRSVHEGSVNLHED
jgi:hypothetical protein